MLTGACLSRAGLNRRTGLATLTLTLALESPDVDAVSYVGGSVSMLQHHRGITHSLVGAPLVACLTVAVVYGIYRLMKRRGWEPGVPPNWKVLYGYALFGVLVHILQDSTNNYGVRPLAPFNPKWYSWDIVPLIDPIMLAALLLGLVVPGLLSLVTEEIGDRKAGFRGRGGAIFALTCLVLVILVRDYQHRRAVNALAARTYHNEDPLRVSAFPQLNPFSWKGLVETNDFFELVPVDTFSEEVDPLNLAIVRYKPEETPVTLAAKTSRLGRVFLDWAQYPITEVERLPAGGGYQVQLSDLRFSRSAGAVRQGLPSLAGYVVLDPQLRVQEMNVGQPPIALDKDDKRRP
jgi:inner membrane protein